MQLIQFRTSSRGSISSMQEIKEIVAFFNISTLFILGKEFGYVTPKSWVHETCVDAGKLADEYELAVCQESQRKCTEPQLKKSSRARRSGVATTEV